MTTIQDLERQIRRINGEIAQIKSTSRLLLVRMDDPGVAGNSLQIKAGKTPAIMTNGSNIHVASKLGHYGETDNYISFRDNEQSYHVGNTRMALFRSATQNRIAFGSGNDVDIDFNDGDMFLSGSTGVLYINENENSFMDLGITIQQGGFDKEAIAFKSTDIAHGITDFAETDTYGVAGKFDYNVGGMYIGGYSEGSVGVCFSGRATTGQTGKTSSDLGNIYLKARKKSGTGLGSHGSNENLVSIGNDASTRWILDAEATAHHIPGSDISLDLIAVQVTGNPTFGWDNPNYTFVFDPGISVGGDVSLDGCLVPNGDPDTSICFPAADQVRITAGGLAMLSLTEDTQDVIALGPGSGDIDINLNGQVFIEGSSGIVYINDSSNAFMERGLTIQQGAGDQEAIALKSTDIAHGMTTVAETDTYGVFAKFDYATGGMYIGGYSESTVGVCFSGRSTTGVTGKTASSLGSIYFKARKKSGTSLGNYGTDENLVAISNGSDTNVKLIVDAEGTIHQIPGSDIDIDLLATQVTGTPTLSWDESENRFSSTHGLNIFGKVGVGTAVVPHGAIGAAMLALEGPDSSEASGPHIQTTTDLDDYPLIQILSFKHNNQSILFDSYWDGSSKSSDASSNFQLRKGTDDIIMYYNAGTTPGSVITWKRGWSQRSNGAFFVNESENSFMQSGITVHQGSGNNEAFAIKATGVGHGMISIAETDTYLTIAQAATDQGGAKLSAFSEVSGAFVLAGATVTTVTTKTTSSGASTVLSSLLKSGTSTTSLGANSNMVAIQNNGVTRWIVDSDGDVFYGGADDGAITDDYDDAHLLSGFRAIMSPSMSPAHMRFKGFIKETEDILVRQGVLTAPLRSGGLVSDTGLKGLLIDAIYQLSNRIRVLEEKYGS